MTPRHMPFDSEQHRTHHKDHCSGYWQSQLGGIGVTDKAAFLNSPVCTTGLFGPAVDGSFAERFIAAQKSSQAMSYFLPKCSNSAAASSHQKSTPTQQPVKPAPATSQPKPAPEP